MTMGCAALTFHRGGKKHKKLEEGHQPFWILLLQKKSWCPNTKDIVPATRDIASNEAFFSNLTAMSITEMNHLAVSTLDAEIRWTLKVVHSHCSPRSNLKMKDQFKSIGVDSDIAGKYSMSKTKCAVHEQFWNLSLR